MHMPGTLLQQAIQPTPGQVMRIWINSDTKFGGTAALEYQVGSTFTKVLGKNTVVVLREGRLVMGWRQMML
jgi:hypothetical protein